MNFRICHQSSLFKLIFKIVLLLSSSCQHILPIMLWSLHLFFFVLIGLNPEVSTSFLSFSLVVRPGIIMTDQKLKSTSSSNDDTITILGFGSLLSEQSSRTTFPDLTNFRLGRVRNYRRVFGHPASIFFQRGELLFFFLILYY